MLSHLRKRVVLLTQAESPGKCRLSNCDRTDPPHNIYISRLIRFIRSHFNSLLVPFAIPSCAVFVVRR